MRFSERQGLRPVKSAIQVDSMDEALRNSLWNVLQSVVWDSHEDRGSYSYSTSSNLFALFKTYWADFFKVPTDQIPTYVSDAIKQIRDYYFEAKWHDVYDFVEFTAAYLTKSRPKFVLLCNQALEREVSGFRFINDIVVPISSPAEVDEISDALAGAQGTVGARVHLQRALELLSDRKTPDYRNSIKESISAVEAVVQSMTGDTSATLGTALKSISQTAPMHPALNKSLAALYGYTSDSGGIRHALLEEPNLDFIDAKFMLVACSAFINYLSGKAAASLQS